MGNSAWSNDQPRELVLPPGATGSDKRIVLGDEIPPQLANWSPDWTFYAAVIWYYDATTFFFEAMVTWNVGGTFPLRITGYYDPVNSVTLLEGDDETGGGLIYGSDNYNTRRVDVQWLNCNVLFSGSSPVEVDNELSMVDSQLTFDSTAGTNLYGTATQHGDTAANNSVTLTNTGIVLKLARLPNTATRYNISGHIGYKTTATAGLRLALVADGVGISAGNTRWTSTFNNDQYIFDPNAALRAGIDSGFHSCVITGSTSVNAGSGFGTLTVQFAQNVLDAVGPTTVLNQSQLHGIRGEF